jgi:hypothetical protein
MAWHKQASFAAQLSQPVKVLIADFNLGYFKFLVDIESCGKFADTAYKRVGLRRAEGMRLRSVAGVGFNDVYCIHNAECYVFLRKKSSLIF